MHACTHAYMNAKCMLACIHAHIHTCIPAHMHARMHAHIRTCTPAYMYSCTHACMHACILSYFSMHTSRLSCIDAYTHARIHSYEGVGSPDGWFLTALADVYSRGAAVSLNTMGNNLP